MSNKTLLFAVVLLSGIGLHGAQESEFTVLDEETLSGERYELRAYKEPRPGKRSALELWSNTTTIPLYFDDRVIFSALVSNRVIMGAVGQEKSGLNTLVLVEHPDLCHFINSSTKIQAKDGRTHHDTRTFQTTLSQADLPRIINRKLRPIKFDDLWIVFTGECEIRQTIRSSANN